MEKTRPRAGMLALVALSWAVLGASNAPAANTDVRVLALHTQGAVDAVPGPLIIREGLLRFEILQALGATNTAFANSEASITLSHVTSGPGQPRKVPGFASSNDVLQDLANLTHPNDGVLDFVHAWREGDGSAEQAADLVVLVVNASAPPAGFDGGAGWIMYGSHRAYASMGFSVIDYGSLDSLVFQHELAHNFGLHHDRTSATALNGDPEQGVTPYAYGYRLEDGSGNLVFRTIMTSDEDPSSWIPYFSIPASPIRRSARRLPFFNYDSSKAAEFADELLPTRTEDGVEPRSSGSGAARGVQHQVGVGSA